jgi:hypothetical protein
LVPVSLKDQIAPTLFSFALAFIRLILPDQSTLLQQNKLDTPQIRPHYKEKPHLYVMEKDHPPFEFYITIFVIALKVISARGGRKATVRRDVSRLFLSWNKR